MKGASVQWSRRWWRGGAWLALLACAGRSGESGDLPRDAAKASVTPEVAPVVLFIGTSITAGYGLDPDQAWPALIQQKIDSAGLAFRVVGAGVSGETSAAALRRLDWVLGQDAPAVVMIETGANDGLRGQDVDALAMNLDRILARIDSLRPRPAIVVAGMEALPNMGARYVNRFRQVYPRAATAHHAYYLPFLLDGVAGNPRFNQADGIHPNAEGSTRVAANVWRVLAPVLDSVAGSR